ncbi:MAG: FecR family protein [Thermodesulfobacteriota bacterium]
MNQRIIWIAWIAVFGMMAAGVSHNHPVSAGQPAVIKMGRGNATITYLSGTATLISIDGQIIKSLSQGQTLSRGDRIRTGKNSRIEVKLPDNSFIRFDEDTSFELETVDLDQTDQRRDIRVRVILGKAWAKVSRLFSNRGRFALSTKTAVAGVRGTTYRMNVNADDSAEVKVYRGEVVVQSRAQADETTAAFQQLKESKPVSGPRPVGGPRPIPGPRRVSVTEWMHILKNMQQINIHPDGTTSKPFRFSIQADENEWVRWNKVRDEKVKE